VETRRIIDRSERVDRPLYLAQLTDLDTWPAAVEQPTGQFVVFTTLAGAEITSFASSHAGCSCKGAYTRVHGVLVLVASRTRSITRSSLRNLPDAPTYRTTT
jgi:hypothetical protein